MLAEQIEMYREKQARREAGRQAHAKAEAAAAIEQARQCALQWLGDESLLGSLDWVIPLEDGYPNAAGWQINWPADVPAGRALVMVETTNGRNSGWRVCGRILEVEQPGDRVVWERKYNASLVEVAVAAIESKPKVEAAQAARAEWERRQREEEERRQRAAAQRDEESKKYLDYLRQVLPEYDAARERFLGAILQLQREVAQTAQIITIEYGIATVDDGHLHIEPFSVDTFGQRGGRWLCIEQYPAGVIRKDFTYLAAIHEERTVDLSENVGVIERAFEYPAFAGGNNYAPRIRLFMTEDLDALTAKVDAAREAAGFPVIAQEWPGLTDRDAETVRRAVANESVSYADEPF